MAPIRQRVDPVSAAKFNRFGYGRVHMDFVLTKSLRGIGKGMGKYIIPQGPESLGVRFGGFGVELPSSAVWPTANRAQAYPVFLQEEFDLREMFWANGTVVNGNVDVAVYDEKFRRISSVGGVAQAGVSAIQGSEVESQILEPGQYWMAIVLDNVTGRLLKQASLDVVSMRACMILEMAAAYPLPHIFVGEAPSMAYVPVFGISSVL